MPDLSKLTGFRGGAVYRASQVLPATAHTWKLEIGTPTEGHPRYDVFDALQLRLMRELTVDGGFPAARASKVLNDSRTSIRSTVEQLASEAAEQGHWRWKGGPFLLVQPDLVLGDSADIVDEAQLAGKLGEKHLPLLIVLPLPLLASSITLALQRIQAGLDPFEEMVSD